MLNIPEDKLPGEFKDEARLDSLFSPFRSHSVNPRDWETKISSWKHLLSLYCINNGVYSFSLTQLNKLLIRNGRPPSCLGIILEELQKQGELQYLEDFNKETPKSWGGWATNLLVKKPLLWSYSTVKRSLFTSPINPERVYIHIKVIQGEAEKLFISIPGKYRNKVLDFIEFLQIIGRDLSQAEDVKLLLHHLLRTKKVDMRNFKNSELESLLIKIGQQDKDVQISEVDISVYVLEQNETVLTKQVENLEDEIAHCIKEVKAHLMKSHRQLAKTCLKKKHEIQKRLTNKTNALHNVQVLLERIKDVQGDAEVWQSYKHAISTFNSTVKEAGLTEDAVEDTMIKLGEMLDVHDDIQSAISKPVSTEDEDLEQELAELLESEEKPEGGGGDDSTELDEQLATLNIDDLPIITNTNVSIQEPSSN